MRLVTARGSEFEKFASRFRRTFDPDETIAAQTAEILRQVREHGDSGVAQLTAQFGGPNLDPASLCVTESERLEALEAVDEEVMDAIRTAHANVREFAGRSLRRDWAAKNRQGAEVGERFDPYQRVGIYVPGGSAPLASTAVMTVPLASVAGVPEIVACSPPNPDGRLNPALLVALHIAGATEIYKAGGAQAIGAMAYGTQHLARVAKIFGPGNKYVVEAKRQTFGSVSIDLLPGPSEIFVIADDTANPAWVAADLLAQLEHGAESVAVAASPSLRFLRRLETVIKNRLPELRRQEQLRPAAANNLWLIHCKSLEEAALIADEFAPEHLSVVTRRDGEIAARVRTAGGIFLGGWSPVAAGDFVAGPSHELPTGGAGKSFGGLSAADFQRRTSVVKFGQNALKKSLPVILRLSKVEGLDAHAASAAIRFEPASPPANRRAETEPKTTRKAPPKRVHQPRRAVSKQSKIARGKRGNVTKS